MRYFLAVAQESSFTRAAVKLGIGQPPLSQQIKDLEQELGTPLFLRTPQGVKLTEAGAAFMDEARLVLGGAERARTMAQRAGRGESGVLRVGCTGCATFNHVVSNLICRFRHAWPRVHLQLDEAGTGHLLDALDNDKLDVAFIRPGAGAAKRNMHRFADEAMKIVLPSSHRLARGKPVPLAALAGESIVLFPRATGPGLYDEIVGACHKAGFEPVLDHQARQISSVINLVAAGLGVSIVPETISQIRVKGVSYAGIKGKAPVARFGLTTREGERSAVVRNFLGLATAAAFR